MTRRGASRSAPRTRCASAPTWSSWSRRGRAPCGACAGRSDGALPVPRRAHAVAPRAPRREALLLLRLRRAAATLRRSSRSSRTLASRGRRVARRALRRRGRVRGASRPPTQRRRARGAPARAARATRRPSTAACCAESAGGRGGARLRGRARLSAEMVERFRLGFAPPSGIASPRAAPQKGYRRPGARRRRARRPRRSAGRSTVFRGRLMFPLTDARGRVRGFAGRVMPGGEGAKYINTRETAFFKKSQLLYGLHVARPAIARSGRAIVVEGYTDVIPLHAAGFDNAVAAMGTSLTEEQLRELRRSARDARAGLRRRRRGQEAALRGMRLAERARVRRARARRRCRRRQDPADLARPGARPSRRRSPDAPACWRSRRASRSRRGRQDDRPDAVVRGARARCCAASRAVDPAPGAGAPRRQRACGSTRALTAGWCRGGAGADGGPAMPDRVPVDMDAGASATSGSRGARARRGTAPPRWPRAERGHLVSRHAPGARAWVRARLAGPDDAAAGGARVRSAAAIVAGGWPLRGRRARPPAAEHRGARSGHARSKRDPSSKRRGGRMTPRKPNGPSWSSSAGSRARGASPAR